MGIVPTFDKCKDRLACRWLVGECTAIKQFAFQGGEEALAEGVIEPISDRAHRWADAGRTPERCIVCPGLHGG
jgi:hypothetical protein